MNTTANESDSINMSEPLLVVTQVSLTSMVEPKFALLILAYATGKYLYRMYVIKLPDTWVLSQFSPLSLS